MKILLAYISGEPNRHDPYISLLPTGVCSLHAVLRKAGFEAVLANFSGWSQERIKKQILELNPEVIGISQWTHNRHASLALAHLVRAACPDSFIMMGGAHATFTYSDILFLGSPIDCVVLGEGEQTVLELSELLRQHESWQGINGIAYRLSDNVIANPPRTVLASLDILPIGVSFLEHSIGVDLSLQSEFIITTRGCPSACFFCSSPKFWNRKVRYRSPENIVNEMEYIRDRFGLIYFSIRDDTFTVDRERTISFCKLLIERRMSVLWNCQSRVTTLDEELLVWMKRAGCECIQLGVESGSEKVLVRLNKSITPRQVETAAALIKKVGINLSIYLISDIPGETEDDIQQTIGLVRKIRPDDGYVSPLAYFPGTRLYDDALAAGIFGKDLFATTSGPALLAASRKSGSAGRLLKQLNSVDSSDSTRFQKQKELLGYCFVTNILAAEYYRLREEYADSERELKEIVGSEPRNSWGWYLLAELYAEIGRWKKAEEHYRMVREIVPAHGPSLKALQIKKRRS